MYKVCLFFAVLLSFRGFSQRIAVSRLRCEYKENPLCIDAERPALSWQFKDVSVGGSARGIRQTAYRVIVADDAALIRMNQGNVWDTKKVVSGDCIHVAYGGRKLEPARAYFWKVMIWDNRGRRSDWSAIGRWGEGLMATADWHGARWIGYDLLADSQRQVPFLQGDGGARWSGVGDVLPLLRKSFILRKAVRKATAYVCGLGQFVLHLNGGRVGDDFLDPGWTKYDIHAQYVAFDVTGGLVQGENVIGCELGNGFYFIPGERYRKISGAYGHPKMICRLMIEYQDGSVEDVVSDASWRTHAGATTFSSIYGGEDYDARLEQRGWDRGHFSDRSWKPVVTTDGPPSLDAQRQEPLKVFERFAPVKVTQVRPGCTVYDLGQNASGIPDLQLMGKSGARVKIIPAELLDDSGMATQKAVGEPVYFTYTLRGGGKESWQPNFMYYGFRYLQVEGAAPEGQANPDSLPVMVRLRCLHTRNSAPRIGRFACSNPLFNKTFSLIDWAIQSNMSSIFTDCPHREKLGWLEEAHLLGPSIMYNYDVSNLLVKVIRDIRRSQTPEGLIPDIAPEFVEFDGGFRDSPEWGSSGIILPWYAYQWFGNREVLAESYDMMTRYAEYLGKRAAGDLLLFGLGDWYDIGPKPPGVSQLTPRGLTATAMYYYDLSILVRVAKLLGKEEDASRFAAKAAEVRRAFDQAFYHKDSRQFGTGSQTANAMPVYLGLVDTLDRDAVIANIVRDIRAHNNGLTAGDIGYRYLLKVLEDAGRGDVIFDMNSRSDVPGYGYQLARGATALTESWQAYRDASNNHFMLGHLMEWFYSGLAGIRSAPGAVAFKEIEIRPAVVGDVTMVDAGFDSPYGKIASRWERKAGVFRLQVEIPVNTRARIYIPVGDKYRVTESGKTVSEGVDYCGFADGRAEYAVGSGTYFFEVRKQ